MSGGAQTGDVRPPRPPRRLRLLRQIGAKLVSGLDQFLLVDDVVAIEDGAALVAGQEYGDPLGDAGADQVAGGGAAAIVEEAGRHPGRLTGGAPRRAPAADGDAVAVEDERAIGVAARPPTRQRVGLIGDGGTQVGRADRIHAYARAHGELRWPFFYTTINLCRCGSSAVRPQMANGWLTKAAPRTPLQLTISQMAEVLPVARSADDLLSLVPEPLRELENPQTSIPRIAHDPKLTALIERLLPGVPTVHELRLHDARTMGFLKPESVHLVVTSPPYWTLKAYRRTSGQLGYVADYERFLRELDRVWRRCYRALVPGGRVIVVVGDVCLSRRKNKGRHTVVPLHASIQEHCRKIGFDNLAPIIWHKISNAAFEVKNGSSFLGKPYEPNGVVKNDIEYILMQRKHGGYRSPSLATRILSIIPAKQQKKWFQQVWSGLGGASTREHPAPYPVELAERLIRMFSFVGDTVLDPFGGTGSTSVAAGHCGRNSISVEIDSQYFDLMRRRVSEKTPTSAKVNCY